MRHARWLLFFALVIGTGCWLTGKVSRSFDRHFGHQFNRYRFHWRPNPSTQQLPPLIEARGYGKPLTWEIFFRRFAPIPDKPHRIWEQKMVSSGSMIIPPTPSIHTLNVRYLHPRGLSYSILWRNEAFSFRGGEREVSPPHFDILEVATLVLAEEFLPLALTPPSVTDLLSDGVWLEKDAPYSFPILTLVNPGSAVTRPNIWPRAIVKAILADLFFSWPKFLKDWDRSPLSPLFFPQPPPVPNPEGPLDEIYLRQGITLNLPELGQYQTEIKTITLKILNKFYFCFNDTNGNPIPFLDRQIEAMFDRIICGLQEKKMGGN